jgi:hypothetical protein
VVEAPRCGVQTTFSRPNSGFLGRFDLEHVETGAGHLAGLQRRDQRLLDDQAAAGAVDDAHAGLHLGDRFAVR